MLVLGDERIMKNILTVIGIGMMLLSGYWMSSDTYIRLGKIVISSDWGTVGLALGACLTIVSIRKRHGDK